MVAGAFAGRLSRSTSLQRRLRDVPSALACGRSNAGGHVGVSFAACEEVAARGLPASKRRFLGHNRDAQGTDILGIKFF